MYCAVISGFCFHIAAVCGYCLPQVVLTKAVPNAFLSVKVLSFLLFCFSFFLAPYASTS